MDLLFNWAVSNKIELAGTVFGLIYIWFSVRQSLNTWPAGIITSLLYCSVYFGAKFYANMGLQLYYLIISVYGWWSWKNGSKTDNGAEELSVSRTTLTLWIRLFVINLILTGLMYYLLGLHTDSPIPFGDAFTTSLSIIATWMLTRKKLEHWLIWIFVDLISISLYLYRGLYFTTFLFLVYTVMAVIGYYEWQKVPEKVRC